MVSEDIQRNRDLYIQVMRDHGTMARDAIVASVTETQAELLSVFDAAAEEVATRKPAPDEWCLRELAMHAEFTERLIAKLIHHAARGELPPAEDLEGAGIGMMPEDDGRSYREILDDLRRANVDLLEAVRSVPDDPDREMTPPHPFFGPLNCLEWAGFQRVHDMDHIKHSRKILAAVS